MIDEGTHYRLLKLLQENPELTQRELAQSMGVSLGKTNYCLKALVEKGLIKAANFKNNPNKKQYAYLLTPKGIEEKARITLRFLKRKQQEYEVIQREIAALREEVRSLSDPESCGTEGEAP